MRKMSNEELKKQQTAAEKAEAEAEADQAADAAGYKTADEEAAEDKYSGEQKLNMKPFLFAFSQANKSGYKYFDFQIF